MYFFGESGVAAVLVAEAPTMMSIVVASISASAKEGPVSERLMRTTHNLDAPKMGVAGLVQEVHAAQSGVGGVDVLDRDPWNSNVRA